MKQVTVTLTGSNTSPPVPLDYLISPFSVSIGVAPVTGTVLYKMQYTYDEVFAPGYDPSTGNWFDSTVMTGKAAAFDTALIAPVRAIRFVNVGTGTLVAQIIQAGYE